MPLFTNPVQPWIVSNDAVSINSVLTVTLSNTVVYLYAFELGAPTTFSGAKWRMGATGAGYTDIGIYDVNGNLQAHTTATLNTASTNMSQAFSGGNITLAPGQYFMALCASSASDTYLGISGTTSKSTTSRNRQATNAPTGSGNTISLPSTTGGYSDSPANVPAFALTISGGLT
jgi:hypothetical protein